MASDFYDLRPEQVPNALTQSFPNVHFLAKSSTVIGLLQKSTTNRSERHQQKHVTVKPVLLRLIYRKTGIVETYKNPAKDFL